MGTATFVPARHPHGGLVYGVILNDRPSLDRMGDALDQAPYKGAPKAPALYIKPYNTVAADGARIVLPTGAERIEIGTTLAVVMGRSASRLREEDALAAVAGFTVAADLSLPHDSYYRPAIREKCFDSSCPLGPDLVPPSRVKDVSALTVRTLIDGKWAHAWSLADLVRPVPRLLADVTEFMTLRQDDILLVGVPVGCAQAPAGSAVTVEIDGIGRLGFTIATGDRA